MRTTETFGRKRFDLSRHSVLLTEEATWKVTEWLTPHSHRDRDEAGISVANWPWRQPQCQCQ
jgi:hypothetical protein